jgi:hypothetical protein
MMIIFFINLVKLDINDSLRTKIYIFLHGGARIKLSLYSKIIVDPSMIFNHITSYEVIGNQNVYIDLARKVEKNIFTSIL